MSLDDDHRAWLWGWDETPGIVSVWAEPDGRAFVWRRTPGSPGSLVREDVRFRPWILLAELDDLRHLGDRLVPEGSTAEARGTTCSWERLVGEGSLRYLVRARDGQALLAEALRGASRRLGRRIGHVRDLPPGEAFSLPPEEQYLVSSGRTYFRDLAFDDLVRVQIDLETTGLDPAVDRVFLVALGTPEGGAESLEIEGVGDDDHDEARLIQRVLDRVATFDPDVIENHNLHGFDLPFLAARAKHLGVPLALGRAGRPGLRQRPSARGRGEGGAPRRTRATVPGRELIDSMDAVLRYDFASRDLPSHGLKAVAHHLGLADDDRELIVGAKVWETFQADRARVRKYACQDVREAGALARTLGGATFALARMVPRRYERLADAGAATGVLDPLIARAYVHERHALPAHEAGDGTPHNGAALHVFACGVAHRIVKADVASLYPSLMRQYQIGPRRDELGVLLTLVDHLVELRLAAKDRAKSAPKGSRERHTDEALSAAMKLVVNSAYGYLGAAGLTRFSDVHAANEVTRRGRALLSQLCRELAARGVTLLEADTDGVYFALSDEVGEPAERALIAEIDDLLPPLVRLEHDGRYAAMLSHEPKNYALLRYEMPSAPANEPALVLRGVAFRSSRAEPYGEAFLRVAIERLLRGDVLGARAAYVETVMALRQRRLPTRDVTARVRLTKTADEYLAASPRRKELPYEAMLAAGHTTWRVGERVRVYRGVGGRARLFDEGATSEVDRRDYDDAFYVRVLHDTFAARVARGLTPHDFALFSADPAQPSLFEAELREAKPVLTMLPEAFAALQVEPAEGRLSSSLDVSPSCPRA